MIFTAKKFSLSISIEHETRQIPLRRWLGLFKHNLRSRNSLKHICMCFQVKRKDISSESKRQKIQFHGYVKPIWIDHGPRGNWVRGEGPVKKFGGKEFCLERMPGIGIITKCFPNVSYWEGSHFSICIFTDIVFKQICILTTLGRCSFGHPIHLKCLIVAAGGWCLCLHIDCVHVDNIVDSLAIGDASHLMAASSRSSLGTCWGPPPPSQSSVREVCHLCSQACTQLCSEPDSVNAPIEPCIALSLVY